MRKSNMNPVKYKTTIQGVPEVYCCRGIIEDKTACIDVVFDNAVVVEAYGNIYPPPIRFLGYMLRIQMILHFGLKFHSRNWPVTQYTQLQNIIQMNLCGYLLLKCLVQLRIKMKTIEDKAHELWEICDYDVSLDDFILLLEEYDVTQNREWKGKFDRVASQLHAQNVEEPPRPSYSGKTWKSLFRELIREIQGLV